jgi:hypothetical protein
LIAALAGGRPEPPVMPPVNAPQGSMRFEIDAPAEVEAGEPVPITLRLTNLGDRPMTVYLQGRPTAFDIVVSDRAGATVWRRLEGQVVPAILGVRTLQPDESLTFEDVWPQRSNSGSAVGPGIYVLTGLLPTDGPDSLRTPPAHIRIRAD